ncbi:MAG TPA: hypothetical protein VEK57_09490 [Thermoanaerobaculia bacterium]|nr:hypothetical protein [Thermoanaerobaculia bacterium]
MNHRSRRNRFEGMDREWVFKLFLCYIQWCIGELSQRDRMELETRTPFLQTQFGGSGLWYEVIEEAFGLPESGRRVLADCWRDMSDEVSADDFVAGFATTFIEKAARKNVRRPAVAQRARRGH